MDARTQKVLQPIQLYKCLVEGRDITREECFAISSDGKKNRDFCWKSKCPSKARVCLSCAVHGEEKKDSSVTDPTKGTCEFHTRHGYNTRKAGGIDEDEEAIAARLQREEAHKDTSEKIVLRKKAESKKRRRGRRKTPSLSDLVSHIDCIADYNKKDKSVSITKPSKERINQQAVKKNIGQSVARTPKKTAKTSVKSSVSKEVSKQATKKHSKTKTYSNSIPRLLDEIRSEVQFSSEVLDIPLDKILLDNEQPRDTINQDNVRELAETYKALGQVQPGVVVEVKDRPGYYRLKSGEHRYRACKIAGFKTFKARLLLSEDSDVHLLVAGVENIVSIPYTEVETAKLLHKVKVKMKWSDVQLGKVFKMTDVTVGSYLKILKIHVSCHKYIGTHLKRGKRITLTMVKVLSQFPEELHLELVEHIIKNRLSSNRATVYLEKQADSLGVKLRTRKLSPKKNHESLTGYLNRLDKNLQHYNSLSVSDMFHGRSEGDKIATRRQIEELIKGLEKLKKGI